jgi:hypothetical protein
MRASWDAVETTIVIHEKKKNNMHGARRHSDAHRIDNRSGISSNI